MKKDMKEMEAAAREKSDRAKEERWKLELEDRRRRDDQVREDNLRREQLARDDTLRREKEAREDAMRRDAVQAQQLATLMAFMTSRKEA
jgi:hypothetical protein